jgi:hypothetical protein
MRRLLSVGAARMGTLAVAQSMASDIALPQQTLSLVAYIRGIDVA